ncbi:MAG: hypothetical protein ACRDSZ_20715 [Pseudonocardiaceae bacterium]
MSLGALGELVDVAGEAGTTGHGAGVSTALVKTDGVPLAGYEQAQAGTQDCAPRSPEAELAGAYAEGRELRAITSPSPVPDAAGELVVPSGPEALACLVASAGTELAESLAEPLLYLAVLSNPSQAVSAEWEDQLREQLRRFLREWASAMDRREHLRLLGWMAAAVAASPILSLNSDEQERVAKVVAAPGRVDAQVIDHIEGMLQYCKRQEDALGPRAVLYTVLAQRELVNSLLGECPDELRPRLLSVYSSMSTSVAIYCFDLDDAASAMRYCDQARGAAQEARNIELAIYALCMMSHFASRQGKAHAGIDFAAAAQNFASQTDDVLLQVCIAERFASAYGIDGQYKESMTAFDRALSGLTVPDSRRSPASPVYWFNEGLIASRQGECLLRLGKPAEAVVSAQQALQLFDHSFVRDFAFCTLHLGTARLLSGDIEEAARVIGEGAMLAARVRSVRLTREVRVARGRMEPWKDTQAVRELDERLVGAGVV